MFEIKEKRLAKQPKEGSLLEEINKDIIYR